MPLSSVVQGARACAAQGVRWCEGARSGWMTVSCLAELAAVQFLLRLRAHLGHHEDASLVLELALQRLVLVLQLLDLELWEPRNLMLRIACTSRVGMRIGTLAILNDAFAFCSAALSVSTLSSNIFRSCNKCLSLRRLE